ncbi:MAG: multicopper oxidase domain-containing protein [Longimicrobiales bacterium]|nr:multicopper oxidase domain-containing protein [Longimicrobiales bacterium]
MDTRFSLSRRRFMRTAGVLGAGLLVSCTDEAVLDPASPTNAKGGIPGPPGGGGGGGDGGGTGTRNALKIPSAQAPTGSLKVAPSSVDLGGGQLSTVWAYNDQFPGPTLVASQGDANTLQLVNGLAQDTITHWHGMLVDDVNDGHPRHAIAPGGTFSYNYQVNQRATLNWYHPHPHELTGEQVAMGLAGAFIIRDTVESGLGLPAGLPYEVPLIIRDASFDKNGDMQYKPRSGGFEGDTPLVNGTLDAGHAVDAAVYRFRILNGSNARIYRLALSNGDPFTLIGNDGGLLAASTPVSEIVLSPAERVDVLVDLTGRAGSKVMLRDLNAGWDLLELAVNDTVVNNMTIPGTLDAIVPLSQDGTTREFSFDGMSKINGKVYDMYASEFTVKKGVTERWRFTTKGNAPHPVHVHGAYFQVLSRTGGRGQLFPWEAGWKDTVLLEDGEEVDVLIRFDHSAVRGIYLIHCHKLEHEDMGMMANFTVAP